MFNIRRALIAALISVFVSSTGYASLTESRRIIQNITNEMLEEYDLPLTQVIFVSDVSQLEGSHADAMAVTQCVRHSDGISCEIYYDVCVLDLSVRVMRNLAAHETAHYINAHINNQFDHGSQWAAILRDEGWRVRQVYVDTSTEECD